MNDYWRLPALALVALAACPASDRHSDAAPSLDTSAPTPAQGSLDAVVQRGYLRALLAPSSNYLPRGGTPLYAERLLAEQLAAELGVKLKTVHAPSHAQLIPWLNQDRGDLIVASLTITAERKKQVTFSRPLSTVYEVLVGPAAAPKLNSVDQLAGRTISVRKSSAFFGTLRDLKKRIPDLQIDLVGEDLDTLSLLERVGRGDMTLTLADSNLVEAAQGFVPGIQTLLRLGDPRKTAWALRTEAGELKKRVDRFIERRSLAEAHAPVFTGDLAGIKKRGVLRVLTRNNAIHFWLHRGQLLGFDYELAEAFAAKLGLRLEIVVPPNRDDLIPWLTQGRGDLIAAGLTDTAPRRLRVDFASPYMTVQEVVVSGSGTLVHEPQQLAARDVWVQASSSYAETLRALSARLPTAIKVHDLDESEEFDQTLDAVASGRYAATVVDSHLARFALARGTSLQLGPALSKNRNLAWAVRKTSPQLRQAISDFFSRGDYKPRGLQYNILHRRYFERRPARDPSAQVLRAGVISPYDVLLKDAALTHKLDWRLLAAQMYQESRFDAQARSWVGARGLMQIMPATGRELGIKNLDDPRQSIGGGARYLRRMLDRLEPTLAEGERMRFALASYNAGMGHVDDARRLASVLKLDPDRWSGQVEKAILLLEKPRYSRVARYGYCRGREPVEYVRRIMDRYGSYSSLVP